MDSIKREIVLKITVPKASLPKNFHQWSVEAEYHKLHLLWNNIQAKGSSHAIQVKKERQLTPFGYLPMLFTKRKKKVKNSMDRL